MVEKVTIGSRGGQSNKRFVHVIQSGLHASHKNIPSGGEFVRRTAPVPPSHTSNGTPRVAQDRRVNLDSLRAAVKSQDEQVAGLERERLAMVDPAAATFANIDDICVNMLRDGKKSETLEYLRRLGEMIATICQQLEKNIDSDRPSAETRRAVPSLPVLTPRPPLRHDQTRSSSAKPPGSHRRRQPDSQRSLPSQREMELDHGTDAAETDRRTIEGVGAGSPPPSVRHKQEWADRRQKLNDALTGKLRGQLREQTDVNAETAKHVERLTTQIREMKDRGGENEKRLRMSMRHMEEELRHSNELNTVQQAELKTLRQRQSETRALVGVQSAEDETAGDWEEKILELAEAEYTIDQLTQRRKTDYKKIKMLQAKVTALETYSQERGEILTHSADLHSKLKSVKGQLAQKGKSLELKAAELARVNATLEELRCKAAGAETERSELAQALVLNTRLQAKLKKTTALLENARQRPPATTVGADQAGVGQLGEFKDLHTELQSFLTLLEAGN